MRLALLVFLFPAFLQAQSSFNVAYGNPGGSLIGASFLQFLGDFGVEAGVGYVNTESSSSDDNCTKQNTVVDANVKYIYGPWLVHPYAQVGFGFGSGEVFGRGGRACSGHVTLYEGIGAFIKGQSFYFFTSLNFRDILGATFVQAGLGFYL